MQSVERPALFSCIAGFPSAKSCFIRLNLSEIYHESNTEVLTSWLNGLRLALSRLVITTPQGKLTASTTHPAIHPTAVRLTFTAPPRPMVPPLLTHLPDRATPRLITTAWSRRGITSLAVTA